VDANSSDQRGRPSISVALCTRNGAAFLSEQLRSIRAQTLAPLEIVLSDDASVDATIEVARAALRQDPAWDSPRLRILRNPSPLGVAKNFERAILACRGDLIALSDQDDVWALNRLERMAAEFIARRDLLLLHSDARMVDEAGAFHGDSLFDVIGVTPRDLRQIRSGRAFDVLLQRNLATGATMMFRTALLPFAAPFPQGWLHDEWLAIIAAAVGRVDVLTDPLIDYRQHAANEIGARRLSLSTKIGHAVGPRGMKHGVRVAKTASLLARVLEFQRDAGAAKLDEIRAKLEHQAIRAGLPPRRLARVRTVVREALSRNYHRYGRGLPYIIQDLLESA
jgi:hypothetical protein